MLPPAQKDVPRVKEICDLLGFRASSTRPHHCLTDATHLFRRSYVTATGVSGKDLMVWKSSQDELKHMAADFLEKHPSLFPAENNSEPSTTTAYARDTTL